MNPKPKVKLCWNCEGRVSLRDENCPYCAVYLHPESNVEDEDEDDESPHTPPYRMISIQEEEEIPKAPYAQEVIPSKEISSIIPASELKRNLMPLVLLLFGSVFLLFGFILLLFSQDGILTLRWNANIWYVYEILAIPLLYFGWRCLEHMKEDLD